MDVITIDSSDEEEAAADTDGKERIMVTSTLRRTLSTQSDDDNSSISSDDIWKTIGLSSRPKKDDSGADNDALLGNFKGRCIISPSEGGKGLQKATQFEHSSVHTVCNVLCVTAPSRKSKETPIIPPSDSDDSSISSADSIWDKAGLPSRSKGDGAAATRTHLTLDNGNDLEISVNPTAPKSDHVNVSECAKDSSSVSSAKFGVSEDLCVTAPSRKSKETSIIPLSDSDDSSISSADSIWDKAGLPPKSKGDSAAAPRIDLPLDNDNNVEISVNPTAPKSDHVRVNEWAKDSSSVSSAKFGVSEDLCVTAPSRKSKETSIIPLSDSDDSSISSADSIWDKAGLPPRSKGDGAAAPRTYFPLDSDNDSKISANQCVDSLPPEVPLPVGGTWRIVLLMDHREFGCANNFLSTVEKKINNGGNHAEITTLPSADYLFVARLISDSTGEVMDERVLDMVIERKNVQDACQCLIADSKSEYLLSHFIVSFCCDSCSFNLHLRNRIQASVILRGANVQITALWRFEKAVPDGRGRRQGQKYLRGRKVEYGEGEEA